jgi:hypothetical protein
MGITQAILAVPSESNVMPPIIIGVVVQLREPGLQG